MASNPHPLPEAFSPSSLLLFRKCPAEWEKKYLPRTPTPGSAATVKGTIFHTVMEKLWLLPATERTPDAAHALTDATWQEVLADPIHQWSLLSDPLYLPSATEVDAAAASSDPRLRQAVEQRSSLVIIPTKKKRTPTGANGIAATVHAMVDNYFGLEDPTAGQSHLDVPFRGPLPAVEMPARARLGDATFAGVIDRVSITGTRHGPTFTITDYKTGAQKTDAHITRFDALGDYWWQQATYAVLLEEMFAIPTSTLRLVFPSGDGGGRKHPRGRIYERPFTTADAQAHRLDLLATHRDLLHCWETNTFPPRQQKLCDWCHFKDVCPLYAQAVA